MADTSSPSPSPASAVAVSLSKSGHAPGENEDAYIVQVDDWPLRLVVADGATESVYAGLWAELCAEGLASLNLVPAGLNPVEPDPVESEVAPADVGDSNSAADAGWRQEWRDLLAAWQSRWQEVVDRRAADAPWYVAEKQRQGAFATVLGLSVHRNGTYHTVSIGDCLLAVQSLQGALQGDRHTWPTDQPEAFTNRPALLSSRPDAPVPPVKHFSGTWAPGDRFAVATDAVAEWLLRTSPDVVFTGSLPDADTLRRQLHEARNAGDLRNDDLTLAILHMNRPEL